MILGEMADEVIMIHEKIQQEQWTPVVESRNFTFPGRNGVYSDATASLI